MTGRARLLAAALVLAVVATGVWSARHTWLRAAGESLVCAPGDADAYAEAVLIDNVDPNYCLFDAARGLQVRGQATTVLVPMLRPPSDDEPVAVTRGIIDLMCTTAGIERCQVFETHAREPISLNLARHVADELDARDIRSVRLVTPGFRSKRSLEVYASVFGPRGIVVHCHPVFGAQDTSNWLDSAHGIQDVVLQFLKLWYYRILVLPSAANASARQ